VKLDLARGMIWKAEAKWPGLTKYLNATELGIGSVRDPLSPNLVDASFSDEGDPLGGLSVSYDWRIMIS
jgi:hypothetical protein